MGQHDNFCNNIMKTLQFFHYSLSENCEPCECGTIVSMRGYTRFEDFYLCVPKEGLHFRSANNMRYGCFKTEMFMNGEFIGAVPMRKRDNIRKLYDNGCYREAVQYGIGYMLWRETTLGGERINQYKEAARISHAMCDMGGKQGHAVRQSLRKKILYGNY